MPFSPIYWSRSSLLRRAVAVSSPGIDFSTSQAVSANSIGPADNPINVPSRFETQRVISAGVFYPLPGPGFQRALRFDLLQRSNSGCLPNRQYAEQGRHAERST